MYEDVSFRHKVINSIGKVASKLKLNLLYNFSGIESYQLIYLSQGVKKFYIGNSAKRDNRQRYQVVLEKVLEKMTNESMYLDIGSQFGYLPIAVADNGYWAFGMEVQNSAAEISKEVATLNGVDTAFLVNMNICDAVENVPRFDVISMLSVFHHIVAGIDDKKRSEQLLIKLLAKVKKRIIIEVADGIKEDFTWSEANRELCESKDAELWFQEFLEEQKFSITYRHEFKTHLNTERVLLVADRL
jgi:hypothetical protein